MALDSVALGYAQERIREAMFMVASASVAAANDREAVGEERINYLSRSMVLLNDAYALARSAVNGSTPALLDRMDRESMAAAIRATIGEHGENIIARDRDAGRNRRSA